MYYHIVVFNGRTVAIQFNRIIHSNTISCYWNHITLFRIGWVRLSRVDRCPQNFPSRWTLPHLISRRYVIFYFMHAFDFNCPALPNISHHTLSLLKMSVLHVETVCWAQGSSFIPDLRLIFTHPYTRQLLVPYCFQF